MMPMLRGTSITVKKATLTSTRITETRTVTMTRSRASWKLPKL